MADRPEVTVEMLVEHWRRQVQKLREAGIPIEHISNSIRTVSLEAEQSWFEWILEQAGENAWRPSRPEPTVLREDGAAEESLMRPAEHHEGRDPGQSAPDAG